MGEGRRTLIVNLSGDQKSFLGLASWSQIGITGAGVFLGCLVFTLIKWLIKASGAGLGTQVTTAGFFFIICVAPFAYYAFTPVRDKNDNLLYYKSYQLKVDHNFLSKEIGTYVNIQHPTHKVNTALPYARPYNFDEGSE